MRQKLLQLLLNPFIIAGLISLIVISFLPDYFSKYKVDLVNQEKVSLEGIVYYADLNNDGKSEKIDALKSQSPNNYNASYMVYKSNGDFVDQFNLDNPFA
ncbi:MAG: hypothetical protein KJO83_06455, partial [Bacteroidia bacterium]|nr:hypothetical protein [Bacteroidia bacterium]